MHGAGGAAAAGAVAARAIKASGAIVRVEPEEFQKLLNQGTDGVIVHTIGFWSRHKYLMGYRGLVFHTTSRDPIVLPRGFHLVEARRMWVPG